MNDAHNHSGGRKPYLCVGVRLVDILYMLMDNLTKAACVFVYGRLVVLSPSPYRGMTVE